MEPFDHEVVRAKIRKTQAEFKRFFQGVKDLEEEEFVTKKLLQAANEEIKKLKEALANHEIERNMDIIKLQNQAFANEQKLQASNEELTKKNSVLTSEVEKYKEEIRLIRDARDGQIQHAQAFIYGTGKT